MTIEGVPDRLRVDPGAALWAAELRCFMGSGSIRRLPDGRGIHRLNAFSYHRRGRIDCQSTPWPVIVRRQQTLGFIFQSEASALVPIFMPKGVRMHFKALILLPIVLTVLSACQTSSSHLSPSASPQPLQNADTSIYCPIESEEARLVYNRGMDRVNQGDPEEAVQALRQAIALDPIRKRSGHQLCPGPVLCFRGQGSEWGQKISGKGPATRCRNPRRGGAESRSL